MKPIMDQIKLAPDTNQEQCSLQKGLKYGMVIQYMVDIYMVT